MKHREHIAPKLEAMGWLRFVSFLQERGVTLVKRLIELGLTSYIIECLGNIQWCTQDFLEGRTRTEICINSEWAVGCDISA